MKIDHHPSDELLMDYSSGALLECWSIVIATHLALCPSCRSSVDKLEAIAGKFLEDVDDVAVEADFFEKVMGRLNESTDIEIIDKSSQPNEISPNYCPEPLRGYIGDTYEDIAWKNLGFGVKQFLIEVPHTKTSVRLLKIPAGSLVPHHSHSGQEMTLVLDGGFSDVTGQYKRGDLQEADDTLEHQPCAMQGRDCICLVVTEAPLKFSNLAVRLMRPFLGI